MITTCMGLSSVCSYRPAVVMHTHSVRGKYRKYKPDELAQAVGQAIARSQTSLVAECKDILDSTIGRRPSSLTEGNKIRKKCAGLKSYFS